MKIDVVNTDVLAIPVKGWWGYSVFYIPDDVNLTEVTIKVFNTTVDSTELVSGRSLKVEHGQEVEITIQFGSVPVPFSLQVLGG